MMFDVCVYVENTTANQMRKQHTMKLTKTKGENINKNKS